MSQLSEIRDYLAEDAAAMAAIANVAKAYPWSKEVFRDCVKAQYPGWVLCHEAQVKGFSIIKVVAEEAELLNLCVDPAIQGHGYGRALLEHAMKQARHLLAEHIFLEVRISNQPAMQLYKRLGFKEVGIRKNYYPTDDGREDAVIMFCSL